MQSTRTRPGLVVTCLAAAVLAGGCTSGFGLATSDDGDGGTVGAVGTGSESASTAPAPEGRTADVPPPAADPASVPGAERFGVMPNDDYCSAAPKVAAAFVGLFDSVYANRGPELQAQVESALVGIDVLRSVAPEPARTDLDTSRVFLSRFRELLAESGWNLEAAAQRHPDFFSGPEPDAGFAAMTAATQEIAVACGFTP